MKNINHCVENVIINLKNKKIMKKIIVFIKLFTDYLRCIFGGSVEQIEMIEESPEIVEEISEKSETVKKVKTKKKTK